MCADAKINMLGPCISSMGILQGEKVRPVSSPTPCYTPPNQLFYFKNSCDPAALVRAGCSLLCYTSEDPKSKLGSFPCHCSRQATGLLGERGSVLMTAKISSMHLELSQHSACPQDKGNYTHLQVSNLAFLVIFFFLLKMVCSLSLRRHVIQGALRLAH